MGIFRKIIDFFKNTYYYFEGKWYDTLDKIEKRIPVYKIIDPIDKVVPSFMLFLLLMVFLLFLIAYLVNFYSPFEVSFTVFDSKTKATLAGAQITGSIYGEDFKTKTERDGQAISRINGPGKNTFQMFGEILFGSNEEIDAIISVDKEGYNRIINQELVLESRSARISLSPIETGPDVNYGNVAKVELVDSSSREIIVDSTKSAYVKFKCSNKNDAPVKVFDEDDASLNGLFELKSENCDFVVLEAKAPGYEDLTGIAVTLQKALAKHQLSMTKISIPTKGTAKIYVSEKDSSPKKMISGVEVKFLGSTGITLATATSNSTGVALKQELEAGTYTLTLTSPDGNYYYISADANIKITIAAGVTSEKEVQMEKADPNMVRIVKLNVVESVDNNNLEGVKVFAQKVSISTDGNRYASGAIGSCLNSCLTDANGLITITGLAAKDDGNVVVSLYKEGYIFKVIKPELFRLGGGPEIVEMTAATSSNSGTALIYVKSALTQKPIVSAKAYLFIYPSSLNIFGISLLESGILTDSNGLATYFGLAGNPEGVYSAQATLGSASSQMSAKKTIDVNQKVIFDLNIDTASSFFKINLLDTNNLSIPSKSAAVVSLYAVAGYEYESALLNPPIEKVRYDSTAGAFISAGYELNKRFVADINLTGYVNSLSEIETLAAGENVYNIRLYKKSDLVDINGKDLNVAVFFDGLFKNNANLISGTRATFLDLNNKYDGQNTGYYSKVDLVVGQELPYAELYGAEIVSSAMSIDNISKKTEVFFTTSGLYSCTYPDKLPVNDDNFFIHTTTECDKNANTRGKQAGLKWDGALKPSVYSFTTRLFFTADANENGSVDFNSYGKEKHASLVSQQKKTNSFRISKPLCDSTIDVNCPKILFDVELNSDKIGPADQTYDSATKTFSYAQIIRLPAEELNKLRVKIYNDSRNQISFSLRAYSYAGTKSQFNETASGTILFDSINGEKSKSLATGEVIQMESYSRPLDANLYPQALNSSNYLVLVAQVDSVKYKLFIDTTSPGRKLILSGARFLAGVPDQNFDAEVVSVTGQMPPLRSVILLVKKRCNTTTPTIVHEISAQITGNYFIAKIPGVYTSEEDCVDVTAVPQDAYYQTLEERVIAGTGGVQDPGLACLDASIIPSANPLEAILYWDKTANLKIVNRCSSRMEVSIQTRLVTQGSCASLASGEVCNITVVGKNTDYSPSVQFSDVLGLFPVYINGKKAGSGKKFALAQKVLFHLSNPEECFIISKDLFDLLKNPDDTEFLINNECQYTLIGDYYIPKATARLMSVSLEEEKPVYDTINFKYNLIATGGGYNLTYTDVAKSTVSITNELASDHFSGLDINGKGKYVNFKVSIPDINSRSSKMMFKWIDNAQDNNQYGAKIDGNIIISYKNGSKISQKPVMNFDLNGEITCSLNNNPCGVPCVSGENHCLIGVDNAQDYDAFWDSNYMYGLFYIFYPEGEVTSIDFNVLGNPDSNYLLIVTETWLNYTEKIPVVTPNNSTPSVVFDSGTFTIYPVEGAVYLLKNYATTQVNPAIEENVRFCSEVLKKNAWVYDNNIYFVKREFNNRTGAVNYCASENATYFGAKASLVPTNTNLPTALINNMKTSMVDANWLSEGKGFWAGPIYASSAGTLVYTDNNLVGSTDEPSIVDRYAPFCTAVKPADFSASTCNTLGLQCDPKTNLCASSSALQIDAFQSESFLNTLNQSVSIDVNSVKSGTVVLANSSVIVWFEAGLLKAMFLGEDYAGYNNGIMNLNIKDEGIVGEQYGEVKIIDYVNRGRTKNSD